MCVLIVRGLLHVLSSLQNENLKVKRDAAEFQHLLGTILLVLAPIGTIERKIALFDSTKTDSPKA